MIKVGVKDVLLIILLISVVILFSQLFRGNNDDGVDIDNIIKDNELTILKNEKIIDSLNSQLRTYELKIDSIRSKMDSSKLRYNKLEIKYKSIKDSIRYLDIDESINFLIDRLE